MLVMKGKKYISKLAIKKSESFSKLASTLRNVPKTQIQSESQL